MVSDWNAVGWGGWENKKEMKDGWTWAKYAEAGVIW